MTRSDRGRALIADLPMGRILIETDGPFTLIRGHMDKPTSVSAVTQEIASIRGVSANEIAITVEANLLALDW